MRHLDLFAGIGGFSLAARTVGWHTEAWVEINPFCQKVLTKNFPDAKGHEDIKKFDGTQYKGSIDIITGGFPCQPYSSAGKRLGTDDERHLWPEMLRVIREVSPTWIVGENVFGITNWNGGLVFEQVQIDLENAGYEVQAFILPAAGVGAPHRRQRVWFVAHSNCKSEPISIQQWRQNKANNVDSRRESENGIITYANDEYGRSGEGREDWAKANHGSTHATNSKESGLFSGKYKCRHETEQSITINNSSDDDTNTNIKGLEKRECQRNDNEKKQPSTQRSNYGWEGWPSKPGICRRDDGIPNRVDRIKALGNAIVPQVAIQIFKAINEYEKITA